MALRAVFVLGLLLGGCGRQPSPPPAEVRDIVQRGPLSLTITVNPRNPWVGDRVKIDLAVRAPQAYAVRFPSADAFGELAVEPGQSRDPRPGAVGWVWRQSFTAEPVVSGVLVIPPLTVSCTRASGQGPAAEEQLVSHALRIEVRSALTAMDDPRHPRDVTGLLRPPQQPLRAWQWALIAGAAVLILAGTRAALRRLRRSALQPPAPVSPEVWALRALAALDSDDWLVPARMRACYYRLTGIVRTYVERKFGLAAPEMTTEEFLVTLARDPQALPCDAGKLVAFLEACDLVKYAALCPHRDDARAALGAAQDFVRFGAGVAETSQTTAAGGSPA